MVWWEESEVEVAVLGLAPCAEADAEETAVWLTICLLSGAQRVTA